MEFWGVEVKSGETFEVALVDKSLHLSQACLGEIKNNKSESVCLQMIVDGRKLVLGTLNTEKLPQQMFDLLFDRNFTLSHNWKNGSVFFYGYQVSNETESEEDDSSEEDSEDENEDIRLPIPNGKPEAKKEVKGTKVDEKPVASNKKDAKQVTIVEPGKDEDDSDDSDSDDSDDSDPMSADSTSDEEGDKDKDSSDDSDDSSDEEEEKEETPKKKEETPKKKEDTPKKQSGKKRQNESAVKTPNTDKKAKMSTPPQKTDGKKAVVHVATPHPSKKPDAKTKSNQKSPASAADGTHLCNTCNRKFKTDGGLQAHNQAKHTSK